MSAAYELAYLPQCKAFEGNIQWMYLDSTGNVTAGVGFEIESVIMACSYPWYLSGFVEKATITEITVEYNRVKTMEPDRLPDYYRLPTSLLLKQEDIDAHLLTLLDSLVTGLARGIPGFDALPGPWKMALLDLAFNLGLTALLEGWPRLLAAIQADNGTEAAAQSARKGVQPERNEWTKLQFMLALGNPAG